LLICKLRNFSNFVIKANLFFFKFCGILKFVKIRKFLCEILKIRKIQILNVCLEMFDENGKASSGDISTGH